MTGDLSFLLEPPDAPGSTGSPEGAAAARRAGDRRRRRRTLAGSALAVALAVAVVAVGVLRPAGTEVGTAATTAGTDVGSVRGTAAELLSPAVPAGWRTFDYGDARLSVPPDWVALTNGGGIDGCENTKPLLLLGATVLGAPSQRSECPQEPDRGAPMIGLQRANGCDGCERRTVAGFVAGFRGALPCQSCRESWVVDELGVELVIGHLDAAERDKILATLTWSAKVRVLHDGPRADTTGWREVSDGPIFALVPPDWPVVPLDERSRRADPGTCDRWFTSPEVVVGHSATKVACASNAIDPEPVDRWAPGLWLAADSWDDGSGPSIGFGASPQVAIAGMWWDLDSGGAAPVAALSVRVLDAQGRSHVVRAVIGLGGDPVVARTIVRSLRDGTAAWRATGTTTPPGGGVAVGGPVDPVGWTRVRVATMELALPPDYRVTDNPCDNGPGPVLSIEGLPDMLCPYGPQQSPAPDPARAAMRVSVGRGDAVACPGSGCGTSGALSAVPRSGCAGCFDVPALGVVLRFDGVPPDDRDAIIASIRPSPIALALTDGPVRDEGGWRGVTDGVVAARVPDSWPVVDLTSGTTPVPSACFWRHAASTVLLHGPDQTTGTSPGWKCGTPGGPPAEATDGLWLARKADVTLQTETVRRDATIGGRTVRVEVPLSLVPYMVVQVGNGVVTAPTVAVVWVGDDPTIARTIVHSLDVAP